MHSYKNSAHLEGLVAGDPVLITTPFGPVISFALVVRENVRDKQGTLFVTETPWDVHVPHKVSKYAVGLKKGTPVMVDGSLQQETSLSNGVEETKYYLRAHRVQRLDLTEYLRQQRERSEARNGA